MTNQSSLDQEFLAPKDVAKYLKVSTETVKRLIRRGELEANKIGSIWRITKTDVINFLERSRSKNILEAEGMDGNKEEDKD